MATVVMNARILSTTLGHDDHGPSSFVHVEHEHGQQGFGGYSMSVGPAMKHWVLGVLDVLEVHTWEKLPGTYCRVKVEDGLIASIGHIIKDQWFSPKKSLMALEREDA